jgi:hypothetical protein
MMNLRLLFCVGMGLFTTYLGLVMLWTRFEPTPKSAPPLKRNFSAHAELSVDALTGEKELHREITVTTQLVGEPSVATVSKASAKPGRAIP